jgi:hypothetical protein
VPVIPQGPLPPAATAVAQQAPTLSVAGLASGQLTSGTTPQTSPSGLTLPQTDQDGYYHEFPQGIEVGLSKWIWNLSDNSKSHWQEYDGDFLLIPGLTDPGKENLFLGHQLKNMLDQDWVSALPGLKQDIITQTQQSISDQTKSLPGGPTYAYNVTPTIGSIGDYYAKMNPDGSLQLKYVVTGNSVSFAVGIPLAYKNVAGLAAAASAGGLFGPLSPPGLIAAGIVYAAPDPQFTATFDIEVDVNLKINSTLSTRGNNLQVTVQPNVLNAHIDSTNWSGDLINYMGDLIGDVKALVYKEPDQNAIFGPAERAMQKVDTNQATKLQNQVQGGLQSFQDFLTNAAKQGDLGCSMSIVPSNDIDGANVGRLHIELTETPLETFLVQINQVNEQFNTNDPRYQGTIPYYWIGQNLPSVVTGDPTVDQTTTDPVTLQQQRTVSVGFELVRQFLPGTGITQHVGGTGPGKVDGNGQLFNGEIQRPGPGQTPLPANPGVCLVVKLTCDYATGSISGGMYDVNYHYLGSVSGTRGSPITFAPNADFGSPGINFTIQMIGPLNTEGSPPATGAGVVGTHVAQALQVMAPAAQPSGQPAGQASLVSPAVVAAFLSQPVQPAALTQQSVHPSNPIQQVTINPQPLPPGGSVANVATPTKPAGTLATTALNEPIGQALPAAGLKNALA